MLHIWETVLIYAVIPLAITAFIVVFSFVARVPKHPKYKLGEEWTGDPVWWAAVDEPTWRAHGGHRELESGASNVAEGAASGKW